MIGAMILAAGRGERMRPLSDTTPKPLLEVAGKPLIVRQIEALARAGVRDIVINASHHAEAMVAALGDGATFGVRVQWSIETAPLETAGGIATAYPLLQPGVVLIVSGDIYTDYDYAPLVRHADRLAMEHVAPHVHLVMVPNPPYHADGDFVLEAGRITHDGGARLTFGNIGLYATALFAELPRGSRLKLLPLFRAWIDRGIVSGELYAGPWANIGTPEDLAHLDRALRDRAADAPSPAANA